jgi:hypothetical protein
LFPVTGVTPLTMEFSSPTCTNHDAAMCETEKLHILYSVLKWEELKPVQNVLVQIIILDIVFQET